MLSDFLHISFRDEYGGKRLSFHVVENILLGFFSHRNLLDTADPLTRGLSHCLPMGSNNATKEQSLGESRGKYNENNSTKSGQGVQLFYSFQNGRIWPIPSIHWLNRGTGGCHMQETVTR